MGGVGKGAASGAATGSVGGPWGAAVGAGLGAASSLATGKSQRKAEKDRYEQQRADIAAAKGELDEWRGGLPVDELLAQAGAPRTSETTTSGTSATSGTSYMAPEATKQFAPTVDMLQRAYTGRVAEADFLPEGLLEGQFQNIAAEEEAGNRELENIARSRGIDPRVLRIGSPVARQAAGARSAARRGAEEQKYQRKGQALGDLGSLAQIWGRAQRGRQRSRTSQRGSSFTTASPNIGDALSVYQMTRPDVILPG